MDSEVFGRDAELRMIGTFLNGLASASGALVLAGSAGAGKTTLLRAAATRAGDLGYTVLQAQPSESEIRLAFAGLADLLDWRLEPMLSELPPPQGRALAAALLLQTAPHQPPDPRVIAAAFRTALLILAGPAPVLVVIDDAQWLDHPTEAAVAFAFRRMLPEHVGLICAHRVTGSGSDLPFELDRARLNSELLPVGGLSIGALHRLLRARLGESFSHPTLRRIETESGGNPFVALELGRALVRRGISRVGTNAMPVPDTLSGLVDERLAELPSAVLAELGLVAVMPHAPVGRYLAASADGARLDAAVLAGVLESDHGRLRFSHPLLSSAVLSSIPPARRRGLHLTAAACAQLPEERARHRALAADGPAAGTASELEAAAEAARSRGAAGTAAELFELAASLTPDDCAADARRRLLAAAGQLIQAGETRAAVTALEQLIASMPAGAERAGALSQLVWIIEDDFERSARLLAQALTEAGDNPLVRGDIRLSRSDILQICGDLAGARTEAHLALEDAERADDRALLASCLAQVFLFDWMAGADADERQLERALELEHSASSLLLRTPPSEVAGLYHMRMGRLDRAEADLRRALGRAEADGAEYWRADVMLRLSLVAARTGDSRRAAALAAAGLDIAEQLDLRQLTSALLYGCGLAALQLGQADHARDLARRGLALSAAAGDRTYLFWHEELLGAIDLAAGDYRGAAARLAPLIDSLPAIGRMPSRHGPATNAAEALIAVGELDKADELLTKLEHGIYTPVTAPLIARCRAELAAAHGDLDSASSGLREALRLHELIDPQPIEKGRTLLQLGAVQRRMKQRGAARMTLLAAIGLFEVAGAALWAERGRSELERISGRSPSTGQLTSTELKVAQLVAGGMTNREAAAELVVSVRAVESTLTKIYAKLGMRSRMQLAAYLQRATPL
jgi:DNA-binding CsgD family transcriptional regulator/tetratricopeptide (TPR) repeat protein